jgi:hypothetical protein
MSTGTGSCHAGVMPLLDYLRSVGVAGAEAERRRGPLDTFVEEYREWLAVERVLSPDTVRGYTRLASRFLAQRVSAQDELGLEGLTTADVTCFAPGIHARETGISVLSRQPAAPAPALSEHAGVRGPGPGR